MRDCPLIRVLAPTRSPLSIKAATPTTLTRLRRNVLLDRRPSVAGQVQLAYCVKTSDDRKLIERRSHKSVTGRNYWAPSASN
jgi:hypothetical protein